jgi:hypothetical protein
MILKQFMVGCSKTINLGNFQSIKVEAQVFIEVLESDSIEHVRMVAQEELKLLLDQTYTAQKKGSGRYE